MDRDASGEVAPLRHAAEYVLPLRCERDEGLGELGSYLEWLATRIDVTVVDGSCAEAFARNARALAGVRHVAPTVAGRNGKARGAVTGVSIARHDRIIIADDDVRFDDRGLAQTLGALASADFVRPQNVFSPRPWHARWDAGRSLINRACGGDYSGVVAVRAPLVRPGYDTDVLFENLELERTVLSRGGSVAVARDIYVERRPRRVGRFLEQRVRQAYDSQAQPVRLVAELTLLPFIVFTMLSGRHRAIIAGAGMALALAEFGRRRDGGSSHYPRDAALWALPWLIECSVTAWIAAGCRLGGGVPYRGRRLIRAASSVRALRRHAADPKGHLR